ncbi:hypothetical protein [Sinosporangium album]|uniref:hypothetical protein n=1 Tax=Sinosporangium album TaxID=504805 RepID=UPI000B8A2AE6|nr:hypothetical protein [Sinosporangium album]
MWKKDLLRRPRGRRREPRTAVAGLLAGHLPGSASAVRDRRDTATAIMTLFDRLALQQRLDREAAAPSPFADAHRRLATGWSHRT